MVNDQDFWSANNFFPVMGACQLKGYHSVTTVEDGMLQLYNTDLIFVPFEIDYYPYTHKNAWCSRPIYEDKFQENQSKKEDKTKKV